MPNIHSTAATATAKTISATVVSPVTPLPETGFLRQPKVLALVPFSKSTLWRRVQARTFPAPVKLSDRVTVWRVEDIRRWIYEQGKPDLPASGNARRGDGIESAR